MNLYATTTSERASKGQGGQSYIVVELNVHRTQIGQIELYYNVDTKNGCDTDEWVLQWRPEGSSEDREWIILAQGNVIPEAKGEKQKGKRRDCAYNDPIDGAYCTTHKTTH